MTALPPILPIGTTVVLQTAPRGHDGRELYPPGAAGVIVASPADTTHAYRVRLPRGEEVSARRRDLRTLSELQSLDARSDPLTRHDLHQHVIYRCIVGSRAYGLDHDASDTDVRGVYLPPADAHWSLYGVPEQLESKDTEECYWELEKYLNLALRANPNVLETLYTPLVEHADDTARELLALRDIFLSKLVYQTFSGYAMSQFKKLEHDIRSTGTVKWKHAMHLVRLLLAGIDALRTGTLSVRVPDHAKDELLAIRDGRTAWEEIDARRLTLHAEFDEAFRTTRLPDRPDYTKADAFLIRTRRSMAVTSPTRKRGFISQPAANPTSFPTPTHLNLPLCRRLAAEHPYPLLFSTVSGAHLYGFSSADSDYDLRGSHILPARETLALPPPRDTVESAGVREGVEIDLVTHDVEKFFRLLLKKNGYVLEQLLSPLVVTTTPEHAELVALAPGCITRFHAFHYLGFAERQWTMFEKETPHRVKPLLYTYRVLLTGVRLMRTGEIDANLPSLNREFRLAHVDDLIAAKTAGPEKSALESPDIAFHRAEYDRLVALLHAEFERSTLPEHPTANEALSDLLVRLRSLS